MLFKLSKYLFFAAFNLCILLNISTLYAASAELDKLLQQAKKSTIEGNFKQLVDNLSQHELVYAGDPNFDYYLGVGHLELGQYSEAIFALNRAVASNAKFAGAKFELARAYFQNKEYPEAKRLFESLLSMDPPKKLTDTISTYTRAISSHEAEYLVVHKPAISFNLGFDSNANNAPDIESILGAPLADKNKQKSSSFYTLHLSDFYSMPLVPDWRWQSKGSAYFRNNPSANFVDMQLYVLQTGLEWASVGDKINVDIGGIHSNVEGGPLEKAHLDIINSSGIDYQTENLERNGYFLNANYSRKIDNSSQFSFATKVAKFQHEPILRLRDMTQTTLNIGYQTYLSTVWQLSSTLIVGKDNVDSAKSPYGNSRYGINLNLAHPINPSMLSVVTFKYFDISYDGLFLSKKRDDTQISLDYAFNWLFSQKLSYSTRLSWFDNDSSNSTGLYSYDKSAIEFGINYQF